MAKSKGNNDNTGAEDLTEATESPPPIDPSKDEKDVESTAASGPEDDGAAPDTDGDRENDAKTGTETVEEAKVTNADDAAGEHTDREGGNPEVSDDDVSDDAEGTPPATDPLVAALTASPLISDGVEPAPIAAGAAAGSEHLHDDHDETHEDENHRSLASKVLTGLVLLLVGGGVALWGAPKVAPRLPAGMGPVKAWLMPGEAQSQQQIAEISANIDSRFAAIAPVLGPEEIETRIATAVEAVQSDLQTRISALSEQVAATDSASIEGRLAQVETRIEGLMAELRALEAQPTGAAAEGAAVVSSEIEGLRAELALLADKQGALSQRIDEVEVAVQRRLDESETEIEQVTTQAETARSDALAQAALSSVEAAISAGEPFGSALNQFIANAESVEIPEGLDGIAQTGVTPLGTLRSSFSDAAHQALRATIRANAGDGAGARLAAFLEAQVASRSLTPREGTDTDAILSRAEDALRRDNLASAVNELDALPPPAAEAMQSWLDKARARLAAQAGLASLKTARTGGN